MSDDIAVQMTSVSMRYGDIVALDDVSLSCQRGEAISVLGPNGAGKSTAIGVMTGLRRPHKGRALIFGQNPRQPHARRLAGCAPQEASFPHATRVIELLRFARTHFDRRSDLEELLCTFGIEEHRNRLAIELSGGQQRRLALALAFCGLPDIVFLDEPTTGVDAKHRNSIWNYIREFKSEGGSLILTTHQLEEAETLSDRICVLRDGRIIRNGTVSEIKKEVGVRVVRFDCARAPTFSNAECLSEEGARKTFISADADQTVRELVCSAIDFHDLEVLPASLEQAISQILETS